MATYDSATSAKERKIRGSSSFNGYSSNLKTLVNPGNYRKGTLTTRTPGARLPQRNSFDEGQTNEYGFGDSAELDQRKFTSHRRSNS